MMETDKLSPTSLAFIALTNEYCQLVENCLDQQREQLVESLLKLLPRIYITALDIEPSLEFFDAVISQALDEPSYDAVKNNIAAVMGEEEHFCVVGVQELFEFFDIESDLIGDTDGKHGAGGDFSRSADAESAGFPCSHDWICRQSPDT